MTLLVLLAILVLFPLKLVISPTAGVKVVHMTSDAPWDPQADGPQELEETLRGALQQHMTHPFDSSTRTLPGLQVSGQESEVDFSVP